MWEQQLLFSHSLHTLPCVKQLCLMLLCHQQLMLVNPGELKWNSLRQATKQASLKLFSLHRRQRRRWHVSAELLPCNSGAAAGSTAARKGERIPRLSASEPAPHCKALENEGSLSVLAAAAGRGSLGPVPGWQCGSSAAGLQASQDRSEPSGRLRRGGSRGSTGQGALGCSTTLKQQGAWVMGKPHHARNGATALHSASQGQQQCNPHGMQVPPALQAPWQEKGLGTIALPACSSPAPRRWRQHEMRLRGPASRALCLPS